MTSPRILANRGPAAAEANRAALIAAARELFATDGFAVPLSRIADRAKVGRASLYRHFPTRLDLGWAIFHENLERLGELAKSDDNEIFYSMWREVITMTVDNSAVVEMVVAAAGTATPPPIPDLGDVFAEPLRRVQARGELTTIEPSDLALIVRMLWGALVSEPNRERRPALAQRALALISPELSVETEPRCEPYNDGKSGRSKTCSDRPQFAD